MTSPFPNSYWLEPGRVLCGEYPRSRAEAPEHPKMTALLKAGVEIFIDLTENGELNAYAPEIIPEAAANLGIGPEQIKHFRHPIRDESVPQSTEEMRAILRRIRAARHCEKIAYIHCWGGVGRTGTVAGCFLNEVFGLRGEEALRAFGKRWKTCEKSRFRRSPETEEQRNYVRDWNNDRPSRAEMIRAAVLGAAVGDALGVPVEFSTRQERKNDPVTGMREFGTHAQPAGTWSDDTSLILATIQGLLNAGGYDPASIMEEFRKWKSEGAHSPHGNLFDIGVATSRAIDAFETGAPPLECGGTDEFSNGNGSLMRILPVALAYADDPQLIEKASEISSLTHAHERSRFCCAFFCLVVSDLLHGGSIEDATEFAWKIMDIRWPFSPPERKRFENLHPKRLFGCAEDEIKSGGHVIDTLKAALWVNHQHPDSFAAPVLHAVNLGGDTDTTACVAAALAALIHQQSSIPENWLQPLAKFPEITNLANEFAEL